MYACQNGDKTKPASKKSVQEKKEIPSVCIWDKGSVRAEPSGKAKWLSAMALGEKVTWLGETMIDSTDHNRKYLKVRLSDSTEGWVSEYVIAINAQPAVITEETSIYRRPDLITITDKEFEPMELVAVLDKKNEWIDVMGKQREKRGWIQAKAISSTDADIAVALLTNKAYEEKNINETKDKIKSILENDQFSNSIFIDEVRKKYRNLLQEKSREETDTLDTYE